MDLKKIICMATVFLIAFLFTPLVEPGFCDAEDDFEIGDSISFDVNSSSMEDVSVGSIEFIVTGGSLEISGGSWNLPGALLSHFDVEKGVGVFMFSEPTDLPAGLIFTIDCVIVGHGDSEIDVTLGFKDVTGVDKSVDVECIFFDNPIVDVPNDNRPAEGVDPEGPGSSEDQDGNNPNDSGIADNPSEDMGADDQKESSSGGGVSSDEGDNSITFLEDNLLSVVLVLIVAAVSVIAIVMKVS